MSRARKTARKPARAATRAAAAPAPKAVAAAQIAPEAVAAPPVQTAASPAGLKLEASCTLRDSIDMQFQLLAVDFGESDVVVDGSAVERIDTAGLQLLLSFVRHQAGRGKPVRWSATSPELVRGSQLLGIDGMLGLPAANTGSETRGN